MDKKCKKINTCKSVNRCLACYGLPDCFVSNNMSDAKLKKIYSDIKKITGTEQYSVGDIREIFSIGHEIYKNKNAFLSEIRKKIEDAKKEPEEKK